MPKGKYEYWITPDGLLLLAAWARDGFTDREIAQKCKIGLTTLCDWKKRFPEIEESLKTGKEVVDVEVENALYKKSTGYFVPETLAFKCKKVFWDEQGRRYEEEEIKTIEVQKYVPPETIAQLAWLNNRKGEQWRRNAGKEKLDEKKFEHDKKIDDKRYW